MGKLAILYYSRGGNTRKMAEFIAEGAGSETGVEADLFDIEGFPPDAALEYDGLIVGSPTYYGSMSCQVKKYP